MDLRCSSGKSKTVNPSERLSSSQADNLGAETAYYRSRIKIEINPKIQNMENMMIKKIEACHEN